MPKEIQNAFDCVIDAIRESAEYQEYLELSQKLQKNQKAQDLILEIKNLQKQIIQFEYSGKDIKNLEEEYQKKLDQLQEIPLYVCFLEKQKEVNEIFQNVKSRIEGFLDELVQKS